MKINGQEVSAKQFAFDGCHKIYLLDADDETEAKLIAAFPDLIEKFQPANWNVPCEST